MSILFKPILLSEHPDKKRRYEENIRMVTRLIEEADLHEEYSYANLLMEFRESIVRLQMEA